MHRGNQLIIDSTARGYSSLYVTPRFKTVDVSAFDWLPRGVSGAGAALPAATGESVHEVMRDGAADGACDDVADARADEPGRDMDSSAVGVVVAGLAAGAFADAAALGTGTPPMPLLPAGVGTETDPDLRSLGSRSRTGAPSPIARASALDGDGMTDLRPADMRASAADADSELPDEVASTDFRPADVRAIAATVALDGGGSVDRVGSYVDEQGADQTMGQTTVIGVRYSATRWLRLVRAPPRTRQSRDPARRSLARP